MMINPMSQDIFHFTFTLHYPIPIQHTQPPIPHYVGAGPRDPMSRLWLDIGGRERRNGDLEMPVMPCGFSG